MASSYIPADENPLHQLGFINVTDIHTIGYPILFNLSSHVDLSILPNNLASLTFNATDPLIYYSLSLATTLLTDDAYRIGVNCIYPLSGAYDTLSRILFYGLMVFSLLFRRNKELATASLATAMTYSAVTAIHALALVTQFSNSNHLSLPNIFTAQKSNDPDLYGVFPILAISGIMVTPILMWSNAVRDYHGQPIILWAVLILAALGCVIATVFTGDEEQGLDIVQSFALCTNFSPNCLSYVTALNFTRPTILPKTIYESCGCTDYCNTFSPTAPMRSGGNMVAWTTYNPNFFFSETFTHLVTLGIPLLTFVLVSGVFGIFESFWSQEDVRNGIFTYINKKQFTSLGNRPKARTTQLGFAKVTASAVFSLGIIVTILAPAVFIFAVVVFELYLQDFPYSEHSDAVGAWGTCVGAALVLVATVLGSYQHIWAEHIRMLFRSHRRRRYIHNQQVIPIPKLKPTTIPGFLTPLKKLKAIINNLVTFWRDPETTCAKRQEHKEKELELRRELEEAMEKHQKEIEELQLSIRDLRSGGHIIQPDDPIMKSGGSLPTDVKTEWDQASQGGKNLFYDSVRPARTFSVAEEDVELQGLGRKRQNFI